jgi:uridylate kinase
MMGVDGATAARPAYGRVLLKISGEALMGDQGYGLHPPTVARIADEVRRVHEAGVEICMVIGGGNISAAFRAQHRGWSGRLPITWACLQQS